jgi:hypothetical protein
MELNIEGTTRKGTLREGKYSIPLVSFTSKLLSLFLHRYLRILEVYQLVKINLEEQALVVGTDQSRQAQLPCQPVSSVLHPHQALALQSGFFQWPLTTYNTKQGKLHVPLISVFLI